MEIFLQTGGIIDSTGMNHLLTYDQIEAAYRPLVEELEIWLQEQGEAGAGNALYGEAWNALSLGYLHLGRWSGVWRVVERDMILQNGIFKTGGL